MLRLALIVLTTALMLVAADYLACIASHHFQQGGYFEYAKAYNEQCEFLRGPVFIILGSCLMWLGSVFHAAHEEIVAVAAVGILLVMAALAYHIRGLWTETARLNAKSDAGTAQQTREMQEAIVQFKRSADAAAVNAQIAQQSLYLLQRPYVVRGPTVDCGVGLFIQGKNDAIVGCTFVNRGMTHAILVELHVDMKLIPPGEYPPLVDPDSAYGETYPPSRLIARDVPERFDVQLAKYVRQLDVRNGIMSGQMSLFLYGFIRYRDIFGKQYRHGFCGRYDSSKNDFVVDGGPGFNYSDDDSPDRVAQAPAGPPRSAVFRVVRNRPS